MSGATDQIRTHVRELRSPVEVSDKVDVLVVAAGFEDRAFPVLAKGQFKDTAHCVLIRFANEIVNNRSYFLKFQAEARAKFADDRIHVVALRQMDAQRFAADLSSALSKLPREARSVAVDISGMPSFVICTVLNAVRTHRSREVQTILYTAAEEYTPTFEEYQALIQGGQEEIELLPRAMALEMSENLILDDFAGYRSSSKSCLAVLAGYEAHRAAGTIDAINPALLLLLYGEPGDKRLSWRLDLSKRLHKKFERGRRTACEIVSTLDPVDALCELERYYNYLIDDYDLVISPIGSKMHTIAAYLFWEQYGEVQITFPLPIGYNPAHSPRGARATYCLELEPRRLLFRGLPDQAFLEATEV